ncbi:zinc ribbon domain-containing protein [Notoacmeibacter ruber]|uniref:Zinc ribbon domain-containing protein n=1 Tax=Notoacmeibacter ruber TaxID=2670375 RepID=A0A3L7JBM5_9HYPH|nr:zinc ribbon domain-containing protein [Notoacmeibacter ruber]
MPQTVRYHCLNCGHNFSCEILTHDELRDARSQLKSLSPVHCPQCNRTDLRRE